MSAFEKHEYQARLKNVKAKMLEKNLDILLTTNPANMNYVSGYDGHSFYVPQGVAVFIEEEEPIWMGRAMDVAGAQYTTWLKDENLFGFPEAFVQSFEHHPVEYFADVLIEKKADGKRIGLEMNQEFCSHKLVLELEAKLKNAVFVDASHMINWIRTVKSENELKYMRQAGIITEKAMNIGIAAIAEGVRECDVAADIWHAQIAGTNAFGGEYPGLMPAMPTGDRSNAPHLSWSDNRYHKQQIGILEIGACKMRYNAPLARTVYVGTPDNTYNDFTETINEGLKVMLDAIKVGVPCEDIELKWRKHIEAKGYSKKSRVGYPVGLGYPPDWGEQTISLRAGDKTLLKENMTIHVLAAIWAEDYGYEVSETVIVKPNGCEPLSNVPQKLFIK
ncbi:MAG: M24 family metallopeptidase [Desulfuromusa sp.]|nr:M24 family metallopeptidase [Desulfuromusa sp.]